MLIAAIHDVAPSTLAQVRWLLGRLDAMGIERRVLKVIPAQPGASASGLDELGELVRREADAGSEIVLHGWSHTSDGAPLRGSALDRVRARLFAADAAEFLSLDPPEIDRRLEAGLRTLAGWGATPAGFCPPAWLATPELPARAERAGLRYLVTLRGVRTLGAGGAGRWITLPPDGYMGTGGIQESLVAVGSTLVSAPLRLAVRRGVERVFLHPQGADGSRRCAAVLARIGRLAAAHRPGTYRELLDA